MLPFGRRTFACVVPFLLALCRFIAFPHSPQGTHKPQPASRNSSIPWPLSFHPLLAHPSPQRLPSNAQQRGARLTHDCAAARAWQPHQPPHSPSFHQLVRSAWGRKAWLCSRRSLPPGTIPSEDGGSTPSPVSIRRRVSKSKLKPGSVEFHNLLFDPVSLPLPLLLPRLLSWVMVLVWCWWDV